jgi:hypothetical protein
MSGTLQDRGVVWKATDNIAWTINNNGKQAWNLTAQHADLECFRRSDGSILATQGDRTSRLTVEANLRFNEGCSQCGETLCAGTVVDKLNSLLWSMAPATRTIQASVYDLSVV